MKQQIKGKVVDAMMKFAKQKPPWGGMKQKVFRDGTNVIYVDSEYNYTTKNYSDIQFRIFRKPMMGKISPHNVHGFNIAYDTNSRYTKNHLTIMKGPFGTEEAQDGRLFMIGVGYEDKTKNWSAQYAEVGMILKQRLDAKVVKGITNHMKLVYKNSHTGAGYVTDTKVFKSNSYKISVGNGPAGGIELAVYRDGK